MKGQPDSSTYIPEKGCVTFDTNRDTPCIFLFHCTSLHDVGNVDYACQMVYFPTTKKAMRSPAVFCEYNRSRMPPKLQHFLLVAPPEFRHTDPIPFPEFQTILGQRGLRVPLLPLTLFFLRVSLFPSGEKWANQSAAAAAEWMKEGGGEASQRHGDSEHEGGRPLFDPRKHCYCGGNIT